MFDPLQIPHVFRARAASALARETIASGFDEVDRALAGGWPKPALIEILLEVYGIGELQLLLPLLRAVVADVARPPLLVWLNPPYLPNGVAFEQSHVHATHWLVRDLDERDVLWSAEQCLRSNASSAILAWSTAPTTPALRRLKLAAMSASSLGIVFRRLCDASQPSPASVRIALRPERGALRIDVIKNEGRKPSSVLLDVQAVSRAVNAS